MADPAKRSINRVWNLTVQQRRELALALLERTNGADDGQAALRRKYPNAPEAMIFTATHHVYGDGPQAVVDFLADAELAIRDPAHTISLATCYEVLYHLYNWLQFGALLPDGSQDLIDLARQMKKAVAEDDREYIAATAEELEQVIEGNRNYPDVGLL